MLNNPKITASIILLTAALLPGLSTPAYAVVISQARVNNGTVSPDDLPGFPATISEPGRHILISNLTVPAAEAGASAAVEITTGDVTLDLNGFVITGPAAGFGVITTTGFRDNITVVNGTVRDTGEAGVSVGNGSRVERLSVLNCGGGIAVGIGSSVKENIVRNSGSHGHGIEALASIVSGNRVSDGQLWGMVTGGSSVVSGNTVENNTNGGFLVTAVVSGYGRNGTLVTDNTAQHNLGPGLELVGATTLGYSNNVFADNNNGGPEVVVGPLGAALQTGGNMCDAAACP